MKIFMYDIARGQSWVSSFWQRMLPDLRDLGYTDIGLYVEQRYHFRSLPQHRPWGGITPGQAREAQRLCKKNGLRLLWFTNLLGHCDGLLENPAFRHLAEDSRRGTQVCPSNPETRLVLKNILTEFASISPGPLLHIGGDEAWELNWDDRCRRRGLSDAELYLDHFRWAIRETKRLGKRPAMWGDMLLKYPRLIPEIDRDVVIYDWHYHSGSADTIRLFQRHGLEVIPTTATKDWWTTFFPFAAREQSIEPLMRDARQLGCTGICQTSWEMMRGVLCENQWERIAAAPLAFEGKPLRDFPKKFFGSARADQQRLRPLLDDSRLKAIHPPAEWGTLRHRFLSCESPYVLCHVYDSAKTRKELAKAMKLVRRARPIVRDIQRAATRRKEYLRFLDLPLDVFELSYDRVETLAKVRAVAEQLYPHRLPNAQGVRRLIEACRCLSRHIARCEKLAARFDEVERTRGGFHLDALRLRRQIYELMNTEYHIRCVYARAYATGGPVPRPEFWELRV